MKKLCKKITLTNLTPYSRKLCLCACLGYESIDSRSGESASVTRDLNS
ncbi:hypothetical protein PV797_13045 [Clostridiaceae bacterium M8S5]|nr:hypothetical protein PV797_13045 [Clostridiaceae bacterium M8S5]